MKADIRQRAAELGFDDCRFTTAAPPTSAEQFRGWLAEKQHGEMAWLERNADKRVEPQKVLPGAKSVICLAVSYATSDERRVASDKAQPTQPRHPLSDTRHTTGIIARYSQFADYHDVLAEKLKDRKRHV